MKARQKFRNQLTTVAELRAQLQEQGAQIQKVNAQLRLKNSAAKTIASGQ
jgi:hypothetical protein